jgi:hypothetical protein
MSAPTPPTARELLGQIANSRTVLEMDGAENVLAARVEAVLALIKDRKRIGGLINPAELERKLDGLEG